MSTSTASLLLFGKGKNEKWEMGDNSYNYCSLLRTKLVVI